MVLSSLGNIQQKQAAGNFRVDLPPKNHSGGLWVGTSFHDIFMTPKFQGGLCSLSKNPRDPGSPNVSG